MYPCLDLELTVVDKFMYLTHYPEVYLTHSPLKVRKITWKPTWKEWFPFFAQPSSC